jgi:Domain of unknown function (DUF397)
MTTPHDTELTGPWHKSSYCDTGGQCVEVAQSGKSWLVRDSKDSAGPSLAFTAEAWAMFIRDIKDGNCDVQACLAS